MAPAAAYWRLSAAYFFYFTYVGAFSPYFPLYLEAQHFSAAEIGVVLALVQVTRVVGPVCWGAFADWLGRSGHALLVCAWLSVVVSCALLMGNTFAWLACALFVQSLATSGAMPIVESTTLSRLVGAAGSYGPIRVWGSVGFIVAVVVLGAVLDHIAIDWFPHMVIATLVLFAVSAAWVPEPRALEPQRKDAADEAQLGAVLRRPEVAALLAACFFMALSHGALYTFYSLFLVANGYSKSAVGMFWSVGVIAEIAVFLLLPNLMARYSLRAILLASFAFAVLRFAAIGWGVASVLVLFAAQMMHGATFGSYHAAAVSAMHRFVPGRLHARGQAVYTAVSFGAGGTLGGIFSGWAWDAMGAAWTFTASSAIAAIGLVLIWRAYPSVSDRATTLTRSRAA